MAVKILDDSSSSAVIFSVFSSDNSGVMGAGTVDSPGGFPTPLPPGPPTSGTTSPSSAAVALRSGRRSSRG